MLYLKFILNILIFFAGQILSEPLPFSSDEVTVVPFPPFIPVAGGYVPEPQNNETTIDYVQKSRNDYFGSELSQIVNSPNFHLVTIQNGEQNKQVWAFVLGNEKKVFAYRTENISITDPLHLGSNWNVISNSESNVWPVKMRFVYPSCHNMVKDKDEEGVDCGGPCKPCNMFNSCRIGLDDLRAHKILKYSTCIGELKHGEFCSLTCPVGYRMKDLTKMKSEIYSQCYDGRLNQLIFGNMQAPMTGESYYSREYRGFRNMLESEVSHLDQEFNELCESPFDICVNIFL
ncbi:hypothetical protein [Cryptosporidium hominis TU502]|uniref:hypothetical protein n=1 Tax=Cryptosporidium hominis (strain TU502) TaxID=353151 RepID=UPI0000453060|nr:hypothetical protein [Cryptosporidium hominis TU502]